MSVLSVTTVRRYDVHVCSRCGLAFTLPRPTDAELASFYSDGYFTRTECTCLGYVDYENTSWASINADRTWDDLRVWAPEVATVPPCLLDVGAAMGDFGARAATDGWDVVLCEISDRGRAAAAVKGLRAIATMQEASGPFGLITMFHVIEHLIDPLSALVSARGLIDDEGLLVIEAPQWRSVGRLVRRNKWSQLKPPEHINFFTPGSLTSALERAGWTVVRCSTPYPRAASLAARALRRGSVREAAKQALRFAVGVVGFGGYLRVVARPA
jgi:hypothetical protein